MKKKRFITFFKWLILGILISGALQISGGSFAAESGTSEAKVTTKHVMFDSLSQAEQEGIMTGRPNVTIQHDEETFQLVYKEKKVTPPIESTVESSSTQNTETESSISSSESIPTTPTVESTSTPDKEKESSTSSSESTPTAPTVESSSTQNTETESSTSSSESIPTVPTVETTSSQDTETESTSSSESIPTTPTVESTSTSDKEKESSTSSSESVPTTPTVESTSTQDTEEVPSTSNSKTTTTKPTQGDKDGQDENQKLPKTGEENQNKGFILLGIVFLFAGGVILIWKGKQGKQLLLLIIIGGAGISVMSQATTLELPEPTVETMAKGSSYQPDTEVEGYEYVGYIHSTADNEVPPTPEEKEGSVYVHYVNEAQEKIHDDLHLTGKVGDSYDVAAIQIPGMTLKETVGDPSGVFEELEKEVTFIYENEKQIGRVQIDFKDITSFIGSYLDVQADENDSSSEIKVKAEGFFFLDTGYRIPNEGTLELSGEVNTPLVAPTELGLGARSHPLGVIYHDSEGREQTAVFTNMKAILSSAVPSVFTEEDQIIIFRMSVPN